MFTVYFTSSLFNEWTITGRSQGHSVESSCISRHWMTSSRSFRNYSDSSSWSSVYMMRQCTWPTADVQQVGSLHHETSNRLASMLKLAFKRINVWKVNLSMGPATKKQHTPCTVVPRYIFTLSQVLMQLLPVVYWWSCGLYVLFWVLINLLYLSKVLWAGISNNFDHGEVVSAQYACMVLC
jgi:hypothetical protein